MFFYAIVSQRLRNCAMIVPIQFRDGENRKCFYCFLWKIKKILREQPLHFTVLVKFKSPTLDIKTLYPFENIFLTPAWNDALRIIFYVIFIERMYTRTKLKQFILRQTRNVYILGKYITLKIIKICFLRIEVIIWGRETL